ncbi:MAG TPA: hypothetical protein VFL93_07325 [Longimicrobiaceae bacterium]|nr:hypothetical protein [Longimicrobiaceae bacterium]
MLRSLLTAALALPLAVSVAAAQGPATDRGVFVVERGDSVVIRESFARTPERLEGELAAPGSASRVAFSARLASDATLRSLELRRISADPTAPAVVSAGTFEGDTLVIHVQMGARDTTVRMATVPGSIAYFNPSVTLMEQIVRRARVLGGDSVEVPVWITGAGGQQTALVRFADSTDVTLTIGGVEVRLTTDPSGRVLAGAVPSQGLIIKRNAPGGPATAR